MTQGIKALRRIQIGKETTPGTAVAATTFWRGTGTIQDNLTTVFPEEDIGLLSGADRSYIPMAQAILSLEETEATFEQLPYLFEMGLRHVDPTTDATGGGIFAYSIPIVSSDYLVSTDLATYTIEGGDNAAVEEFAYGFARSITLSGDAGGALMMSAEIVGRQVGTTDFTTGLSIPDVEEILFSKGKLYISDVSGYPSTDLISNEFLSMDLSINTGWTPVYTADGSIYFSFVKLTQPEVILQITFEHNTNAIAEKANWRAGTARVIRLEFDGSAATKELLIDIVGKWESFEALGERDGNDIVTGVFRGRYNATAAHFFDVVVRNNLASLP